MKIFWFFILLFCLAFFESKAQQNCNLQLSGTITDHHDGSVLAFSTLFIIEDKKGVVADENGYYMFENLCPKTIQVVVSHIGCSPDTLTIKLEKSMKFNFNLEHHAEELKEVSINSASNDNGFAEKEKLSESDFFIQSGKALADILSEINGVSSFKTGSNISKPVISGFKNNRVQLINNGVQLQSQQWGDEHAPEIDPFASKNYSIIKGAGAVKYAGGALGGIVLVEPKSLNRKVGVFGELNALFASNNRMGNTSLMLEGTLKSIPKIAWRIQGSAKQSGNIKTPNYYQKNTGVKELNGSADFGYFGKKWNMRVFYSQFTSEIGIFSGAHIGNLTDLRNAIELGEPREEDKAGFSYEINRPFQSIIHETVKAEMNYYTDKVGKFNLVIARQFNIREEYDKDLPRNDALASLNIPELSLSLESYSAKIDWNAIETKTWKTDLGILLMDQVNKVNSFTDFIPDYDQLIYSAYLLEQWEKENVGAELGIRIDRNEMIVNRLINRNFLNFENSFNSFTFNLGFNYDFDEKQQIKLNATYAERPPSINELYSDGLHHGTASIEVGNSTLTKEKSKAINVSYELEYKNLNYEIYGYLQHIEDFIYLNPDGLELTIRGAFPAFSWQNTTALIRGFDQTIKYQLHKNVQLSNQASFLWANNLKANNFLINMPSNRIENSVNYKISKENNKSDWRASAGHQYIFKQTRYNKDQEFSTPPNDYQLVYLTMSYKTTIWKNKKIELGLRIDNLFNTVYRDYLNRFRYFADEQGRNITMKSKFNF